MPAKVRSRLHRQREARMSIVGDWSGTETGNRVCVIGKERERERERERIGFRTHDLVLVL